MYQKISNILKGKRPIGYEDLNNEKDPSVLERFRAVLVQNAKHRGVIPDDECCSKYGIDKDTVCIINNNNYPDEFAVNTNIRIGDIAKLETFEDINSAFEFVSDEGIKVVLTKNSRDIKYIWVQIGRGVRFNFPMIGRRIKNHLMVIMIHECLKMAMTENWFAKDCPDFKFDDCIIKRWAWVKGTDEWHVVIDGIQN